MFAFVPSSPLLGRRYQHPTPFINSVNVTKQFNGQRHCPQHVVTRHYSRRPNYNITITCSATATNSTEQTFNNNNNNNDDQKDVTKTAIILVDHGSKRQAANDMIFKVAAELQTLTDLSVLPAHMELASPSIHDAISICAQRGHTHVIIVPFFLSPGRHVTQDIPQLTEAAVIVQKEQQNVHMTYEIRPPLGEHPKIYQLILDSAFSTSSSTLPTN